MDLGGIGVISVKMVNSSSMDLLWVVPSSLFGILSSLRYISAMVLVASEFSTGLGHGGG